MIKEKKLGRLVSPQETAGKSALVSLNLRLVPGFQTCFPEVLLDHVNILVSKWRTGEDWSTGDHWCENVSLDVG